MKKELIFLGTGEAMVTKCYHACFVIKTEQETMLIDAGGGNGILVQLERAGIPVDAIDALFLTHIHTDHLLGAVWLLRDIGQRIINVEYSGHLKIYGHDEVIDTLTSLCRILFKENLLRALEKGVSYRKVTDGEEVIEKDKTIRFFDIQSQKCKQFALRVTFCDNATLAYLGDEPYNAVNREHIAHVDWLISEAFCLQAEADQFRPYEIKHSTALDAARNAKTIGARNLILIHTVDNDLRHRKARYTKEAKTAFDGNVLVPDDLESVTLD
ncbi:MAG: MBL fold metallo-hydrolase [Christensenellales bacterium]|jgi:ribonuclease Z